MKHKTVFLVNRVHSALLHDTVVSYCDYFGEYDNGTVALVTDDLPRLMRLPPFSKQSFFLLCIIF